MVHQNGELNKYVIEQTRIVAWLGSVTLPNFV